MASTIKIKRSNVAGNVPDSTTTPPQIVEGELALNTADRLLYSHGSNTTFEIGANTTSSSIKGTKVAGTDFSYAPTPADKENRLSLRVENTSWGSTFNPPTLSKGSFIYSNTQNSFSISYRTASNEVDHIRKEYLSNISVGDVMWVVDQLSPEYRWGITVYAIEHNGSADVYKFRSQSGVSPASVQSGTAFGYEKLTTEAVHANADTNITVAAQEFFKGRDVYVYVQPQTGPFLRASHSKDGVPIFQANGVAAHTSLQDAKNSFQTTFESSTSISPLTDTNDNKSYFSTQSGIIDLFMDVTQDNQDMTEVFEGIQIGDVISVVHNGDTSKRITFTVASSSVGLSNYIRAYAQSSQTDYVLSNLNTADGALQEGFAGATATVTIIKKSQILPYGKFNNSVDVTGTLGVTGDATFRGTVTADDYTIGQANTVIRSDCRVLAPHAAEKRFLLSCVDNDSTTDADWPTNEGEFYFIKNSSGSYHRINIKFNTSNSSTRVNHLEWLPFLDTGDIVHITSKNDPGKFWSGVLTSVPVWTGFTGTSATQARASFSFNDALMTINSQYAENNLVSNITDEYFNFSQEDPNDMFAGTDVYLSVSRSTFLPKLLSCAPTPCPNGYSLNYTPKININGSEKNTVSTNTSVNSVVYKQCNEIGIEESYHGNLTSGYVDTVFKIHTSNQGWVFKTDFHNRYQAAMSLDGSGNMDLADSLTVGRGTSNTNDISLSYTIYCAGQIFATSNITAYSDRRAKENIKPINDGLEKVLKMQGVYYNMKDCDAKEEGKKNRVGVIAQDIEKILPEVVCHSEDTDVYSVDYGNITAVLIEAIKDQQKIIDKLEERIQIIERSK